MSVRKTRPEHEVAYQDLVALCRKHADKLSPLELLAVAANMIGKLVALQDQRTTSPSMAMEVVAQNLEVGNLQAIQEVQQSKGSA